MLDLMESKWDRLHFAMIMKEDGTGILSTIQVVFTSKAPVLKN